MIGLNRIEGIAISNGWETIDLNKKSKMISFKRGEERINVYYTTMTVGTCINHPV